MSNDHLHGSNAGSDAAGLQDRASKDLGDLSHKAKEDFDTVRAQADHEINALGNQARDKVDEASAKARSFAEDQKDLAAHQIGGVAEAIAKVADELQGGDQQTIARYARDLAQGLSRVGTELKRRDSDDLLGAAESFGRNQPVAFLGAAALTGFVASRFALASAQRRANQSRPDSTTAPHTNRGTAPGLEKGDRQ